MTHFAQCNLPLLQEKAHKGHSSLCAQNVPGKQEVLKDLHQKNEVILVTVTVVAWAKHTLAGTPRGQEMQT